MTQRINVTLDDSVAQLLDEVGNRSAYLQAVFRARWREWQQAMVVLAGAGWTGLQVLAACDALNGWWRQSPPSGCEVAAELEDHARYEGAVKRHGLDGEAYREQIERLRSSNETAWAVHVIANEYWTGNEAAQRAIARLGTAHRLD